VTYIPAAVPMGELHYASAVTTLTTKDTWYKCGGTTTLTVGERFDMPANNRLRYTGWQSTMVHAGCTFSFTGNTNNQLYEFVCYRNGVLIVGAEAELYHTTAADMDSSAIHFMAVANHNDYYELWVRNRTSNTTTITIDDANMFAVALRV
jgi:hypothetical protein